MSLQAAKISEKTPITRLAPSPTGALHLGNARTFLINWCLARAAGWRVVLRIEDLDTPRVKPGVVEATIETLRWLGLDWDEGPHFQTTDLGPYRRAMRTLADAGRVYPCTLSRNEILASASAPNEGDHEIRYDASLRPADRPGRFDDPEANWRLAVYDGRVRFEDAYRGRVELDIAQSVGDFVVWTKRACPSYQLAVVVDDARQGITEVVRGDDLLDSAGRQMLLYSALNLGEPPRYTHLPLVRGTDGRRLAKRHGDTRIDHYRAAGVPAARLVALLARWCGREAAGAGGAGDGVRAADLIGRISLDTIPRADITFRPEDDAWLRLGAGR
ncbi:MAG: tRNA glutamyl-Q(34) synthetase GluQRS [Phycisphaerales bacterium]|nr:tRNA glutamyl-Q(34) synthetase GluQRS [Phycisphaerales bacterium]